MTPAEIAAIVWAILSLIASGVAIVVAFRAADRAQRAVLAAAGNAFAHQPEPQKPAEPSREERIAWARGEIAACQGAELALAEHASQMPAAAMLAQYRANAARAKQLLRLLGVEA